MTRGETIVAVLYGLFMLSLIGVTLDKRLKRIQELLENIYGKMLDRR